MKKTSVVVSLLGLAYKPYTYLTERSQQLEVAKALLEKENISELRVYDPLVNENYGWIKSESLEECVDKADIVAILTPYPEFLDVESWKKLIKPEGKIINFWS
jgi:UDP-N-acetyl-D-mannosaminuronate dehydrogenase